MSDKNIYQRINAVMNDVKYVKKDKQVNAPGQNYKAVTHDQVVSVARESMVKHGIVVYPEQINHEMLIMRDVTQDIKMHLYSGDYIIHFVNCDDPKDEILVKINAHAADNGDKAPGKCVTYATKTATLKVLNLETGENDESREEIRERSNVINQAQYDQLSTFCLTNDESGNLIWSELGVQLASAYNISVLAELPKSKFNEALSLCRSRNGNN